MKIFLILSIISHKSCYTTPWPRGALVGGRGHLKFSDSRMNDLQQEGHRVTSDPVDWSGPPVLSAGEEYQLSVFEERGLCAFDCKE